jgi:hypothetical protein
MTDEHLYSVEGRLVKLEVQVGRFIADIESEKGTRQRVSVHMNGVIKTVHEEIKELQRMVWKAVGGLIVIQALIGWGLAFYLSRGR